MNVSKIVKYTSLIGIISLGSILSIKSKSSGVSAAYTGAPSESTCTSCHGTYSLQTSGTNYNRINLTGNFSGGGYIPDSTYKIVVSYKESGKSIFGFQLTALQDKNVSYPTPAGTFISKDSRTSTFSQTAGTTTRYYIEHTSTGTSSVATDSVSYVFEWKAPSTNLGNIKFHLVLNVTNNNNNSNGDYIYSKSFVLSPSTLLPVAKALISDTLYCSNKPITFKGTSTNNATSYSWKFPGGSITTSNTQNPTVIYNTTGTKMAILESKNAKGFSKPDTLIFNVIQGATNPVLTPSPVNGPVKICEGDSAFIKVNSALNHTYLWSPSGQKSLGIFAKKANDYVVTAINSNGCKKTSNPIQLVVNPRPNFQLILNPSTDSICFSQTIQISFKNKLLSDSFKVNQISNQFFKDSFFNLNLNKGQNNLYFSSKSTNGCVSLVDFKTIFAKDSADAPILNISNRTANSVSFQWTTIPNAIAFVYSIDSGKTWKYPTNGILSQNETITPNSIGLKTSFWLKAITNTYCNTSKITSLVGQPLGCNDIPYVIVPQKSTPCYGDSVKIELQGLYNSGRYIISYNNIKIPDTLIKVKALKTNLVYFGVLDTLNKICGETVKTFKLEVDSGNPVKTDLTAEQLTICGGKNNANISINVNLNAGDSLWVNGINKGNSNPFTIPLIKNELYTLKVKNTNQCFGIPYEIKPEFRNKIIPDFMAIYQKNYEYQFVANDSFNRSQWILEDNQLDVDTFYGISIMKDLSSFYNKTIKIKHFKQDTFNISCFDSASKLIQVLDYSNSKKFNKSTVRISPNPIIKGGQLNIQCNEQIEKAELFTIEGQKISALIMVKPSVYQIPTELSNSVYILKIQTSKGSLNAKILLD